MDLPVTLVAAAVGVVLTVFFGWRGAKAPDLIRGPRLAPYRFLMVLSACWVLLMIVHAVNLLGVTTGQSGY